MYADGLCRVNLIYPPDSYCIMKQKRACVGVEIMNIDNIVKLKKRRFFVEPLMDHHVFFATLQYSNYCEPMQNIGCLLKITEKISYIYVHLFFYHVYILIYMCALHYLTHLFISEKNMCTDISFDLRQLGLRVHKSKEMLNSYFLLLC